MRIAMRDDLIVRSGFVTLWIALIPIHPASAAQPNTYGTTAVSYARVPATDFYPTRSSDGYTTGVLNFLRYEEVGGTLAASVSLPSGAKLVSMRFEFDDADSSASINASLRVCPFGEACSEHPAAGAGPADCAVSGRICSGDAYEGWSFRTADLMPDDITIDNLDHSYYVLIQPSDSSLRIAGVVFGYVLQVSPAPATATFNDVPTGHRFFQFVEAMEASGITAGCGGGNFCPDQPLTRGQMTAFLAKALGLQWP
jgi:hypothetical protein